MPDDSIVAIAADGDLDGVKRYLASGGDVNDANSYGINAAIATCFNAGDKPAATLVSIIEELVKHDIDLEQTATFGRNPPNLRALHMACITGQAELSAALVAAGADVNAVDGTGASPLYKACQNRHVDIIHMLLDNGADASIKTSDGATPLILIADPIPPDHEVEQDWDLDARLGSTLIKAGVDVAARDEDGASALLWCCQKGHHELARIILEEGKADANARSDDGRTALFDAVIRLLAPSTPPAEKHRLEILIDVLMDGGADETIPGPGGQSAWDLARDVGRPDVMKRIDTDLRRAQSYR